MAKRDSSGVKTWLITGCSSGLGRTLAEAVLDRGDNVFLTARSRQVLRELAHRHPGRAHDALLDVTSRRQVADAVRDAEAAFGAVDVLVNNAGYGILGAIEETAIDAYRLMFEANFFGAVALTQAVLPGMRMRHRGCIVNVSSMGGFAARAGFGFYNASKFALEGFSEALAQEVAPLGIKVLIIEPGALRTDFAGRSLVRSPTIIDDYAASSGQTRLAIERSNGNQPGDPRLAAEAIIAAVDSPHPPLRLVLGKDAVARMRAKLGQVADDIDRYACEVTVGGGSPPPELSAMLAEQLEAYGKAVREIGITPEQVPLQAAPRVPAPAGCAAM